MTVFGPFAGGMKGPSIDPLPMPEDRLLKVGSVARILGVHERSVQRWCSAGKIPSVTVCGCRRIRSEDVNNIVANGLRPLKPSKSSAQ